MATAGKKLQTHLVAPTLITTLLSAFPEEEVSVQALLRAGVLFGVTERGIRVALGRLSAEKKIQNTSRGNYMSARRTGTVHRAIVDWRPAEIRIVPWDRSWLCMLGAAVSRGERTQLNRHEQALRFRGFRELLPSFWVRPANLRAGLGVRDELCQLGLHPHAHLMVASEFEKGLDTKARKLWKPEHLEKKYASNVKMLETSMQNLNKLTAEDGLVETLTCGRAVIRDIVLDPLLPQELVDVELRRSMIEHMKTYDDIGHKLWRSFLFS
ncbi:hypothetical protein [Comamonas flocculans]|uniref:PaaX family transcriptional regulator n=1 Tax=Comamonas flocculans TaxID=2597701 RepID=A0A5B8RSA2_9BURK|nr:hypothetical protein [Comamonas flocculans]QEA11698.1 hypothetical protein FOZ74_00780 [Comamonas flocculans]